MVPEERSRPTGRLTHFDLTTGTSLEFLWSFGSNPVPPVPFHPSRYPRPPDPVLRPSGKDLRPPHTTGVEVRRRGPFGNRQDCCGGGP